MHYVRFAQNNQPGWGIQREDLWIQPLTAAPYAGGIHCNDPVDPQSVRLLAPCEPSKIVAVGKNYRDHIAEFDSEVPETPILFIKPSTAVNDPQSPIWLPSKSYSKRIDYECELAVVMARKATRIRAEDAAGYILGYTALNDVTARDIQAKDGQWTRAKGMDGFAPIGPVVTDEIDPDNCLIRTRLNGIVKQEASTRQLIWPIGELIAFITASMTLLPGDVVTTGTPSGVGPMEDGDTVEIEIDGIGVLSNPVRASEKRT